MGQVLEIGTKCTRHPITPTLLTLLYLQVPLKNYGSRYR